ncbi:uncharacterized protein LOC128672678 [Plodia interpunctella]|uniref:uncharacterized protein LOC128672678 n=1 Tax=Plodia interpunctella TaxID=58824 RepID=UPI002367FC39|nr:uncharacterized protein LOC128672678 [Plodia interpunctella]
MLYTYFVPFNIVCGIFGVRKPSLSPNGKIVNTSVVHRIWSLIIILSLIAGYCLSSYEIKPISKVNLLQISILNDLANNVIILLLHNLSGDDITKNLYNCFIGIVTDLGLHNRRVRILMQKLYFWFSVISITYIAAIILEILYDSPPYNLIIRIPTFLTVFHLIFHLSVLVAILKILNYKLKSETLIDNTLMFPGTKSSTFYILKYFLNTEISFIEEINQTQHQHLDLKHLCKIYDKMATCLELLIKLHGLQVPSLLISKNRNQLTLRFRDNNVKIPWLACVKTVLPYFWCYIGAYVGDQMRKQVDSTEIILIKHLINFQCDQTRKTTLETFKQLVGTHRLQFTACSLFDLSFSMILTMAMNVITYSIILIQLYSSG